jgi:hypothetical protein
MPAKIARSSPRPSLGLPELLVATHISRPGFQGRRKIATIHAGLGVIQGMSDQDSFGVVGQVGRFVQHV